MIFIEGIIYKLLGGTYYVKTKEDSFECRARGLFRLEEIKPLVGDYVRIKPDEFDVQKGYIIEVLPRKSELIRPPVANVDQAVIVVAIKRPQPNIHLLDKMLLSCELAGICPLLVINKCDLDEAGTLMGGLAEIYQHAGYKIIETSAISKYHLDQLLIVLEGHVSVFAGASGVGKSSLLNAIMPSIGLPTGEISKKIKRGKHTTRHTELISLPKGGYVLDTPGFTSLDIKSISMYDLDQYFPEINRYRGQCKFNDCLHINEPSCAVIEALNSEKIHFSRYQSYKMILRQLESDRRNY